VILSAGALVERKGHHRIIQALTDLTKGGVRPQLAIAGASGPEGAFEQELRALVRKLALEADVRFLGQATPDVLAELMSAADVFCLASTNEGWPNVVHEALACGAPVVATDVGAIPQMLPDPRYGVIVPVNDQNRTSSRTSERARPPLGSRGDFRMGSSARLASGGSRGAGTDAGDVAKQVELSNHATLGHLERPVPSSRKGEGSRYIPLPARNGRGGAPVRGRARRCTAP
jgi:hypothetical protein